MSERKTRPTMGTWHVFDVEAIRQEDGDKRKWIGRRCPPTKGMFTGYRFKQNGIRKPSSPDPEGIPYPHFRCYSTTEIWLFVTDPRYNPIEVMPFGVLIVEK